jgi:hypothetical protein
VAAVEPGSRGQSARRVAVTLVAQPGTAVVRLRVFGARAARSAASARLRRKPIATEFRSVTPGRRVRVKLSKRTMRKLRAGRRYVLEVTPGASRTHLGKSRSKGFRLKGR